jgi:nucleotide-binding universal stress UspA family protein
MRTRLDGQGVEISHMIIDDEPHLGIIKSAASLGADLVVTGIHGHTGLKRLLVGSVAERVVRGIRTNVLVTRGKEHPRNGYRHILIPTDFSPSARDALELACLLVAPGGAIDVRHYWHEPVFGPVLNAGLLLASRMQESTDELGRELLSHYKSDRYHITFTADGGLAKMEILEQLGRSTYDLVAMGSHGRRGLGRWVLGSTAESTVRHSNCSVLVTKSAVAESAPQS